MNGREGKNVDQSPVFTTPGAHETLALQVYFGHTISKYFLQDRDPENYKWTMHFTVRSALK